MESIVSTVNSNSREFNRFWKTQVVNKFFAVLQRGRLIEFI